MPFVKGQSGNPLGRRKAEGPTLTDLLRASMHEKIVVEDADGTPVLKTRRQVLIEKLFEYATNGQAYAMQLIWERLDGKLAPTPEDATSDAAQVASAMMRTILDAKAKERERDRLALVAGEQTSDAVTTR
jgi:hypothetical protein